MKNRLITFNFEKKEARVVILDGEPWWTARDVAGILGYKKPLRAIKLHCKGAPNWSPLETAGGIQKVRVINEGDVFRLIVGSAMPEAQRFEKWLFDEALPQIRRTGSYSAGAKIADDFLSLKSLEEDNAYLRDEVAALRRMVRRYETRNFITTGDKIDILTLYVRKYPVSAIQVITKKGRTRIKKFLDGFLELSPEERDAEIVAWYEAEKGKGGAA
jgi:prophage antirepressor-like protein